MGSSAAVVVQLTLLLHAHFLTMHLVRPADPAGLPLIIYATGDGGWRGKDLSTYKKLVSWGYPLAGFSSPDYVKHLGKDAKTISPAGLAVDYEAIIRFARMNLGLAADVPVVLVGVSRGAGLSVVAAGQWPVRDAVNGVVAIGLTGEEEYVYRLQPRRLYPWTRRIRMPVMLQIYPYLPRLRSLPLAVVQSTHDEYLPAPRARELFGPDTDLRRFRAIESRNHSFSDAREAMYAAVKESLNWLTDRLLAPSRS